MATKFTVLPCGLKLRLNVETGEFILRGDMGHRDPKLMITKLNIVTNTENLLALAAFFLARAQENLLQNDD